jgi:hypothetical protein
MSMRINPWYVCVLLALVAAGLAGALLAAGYGSHSDAGAEVRAGLNPLPTPASEPTPTIGWWGAVTVTRPISSTAVDGFSR